MEVLAYERLNAFMELFRDVKRIDGILVNGFAIISFLHQPFLYSNHCNPNFMFVSNVKKSAKNRTVWSVGELDETKMTHAMFGSKVKHDSYVDFIF